MNNCFKRIFQEKILHENSRSTIYDLQCFSITINLKNFKNIIKNYITCKMIKSKSDSETAR